MTLSKTQQMGLAMLVSVAVITGTVGVVAFTSTSSLVNSRPSHAPKPRPIVNSTTVFVGDGPEAVLFDSNNQLVYVAAENSNVVTVVSPRGLQVVASIPSSNARGLALDPASGRLFVSNGFGDTYMVVNTTKNSEGTNYTLSGYTYLVGAQYDTTTGQLFFLANNNDDILSVNSSTYALSHVVPVQVNTGGGTGPIAAVNPQTHVMYYAARGSMGVDLIGELNATVFGFFPTGASQAPLNTFYDPFNHLLYVALGGWLYTNPGDQVLVLNATTGVRVANMTVGWGPGMFAYDSSRHLLYVSCTDSGTVSAMSDITNQVVDTISLGPNSMPGGITIDPSTGSLFVGEAGTGLLVEMPPA